MFVDGQLLPGKVEVDEAGNIKVMIAKGVELADVPSLAEAKKITLRQTWHMAWVTRSNLKTAYLTVFALLGPAGYDMARTAVYTRIRSQILESGKPEVYTLRGGDGPPAGVVGAVGDPAPGWAVRVSDATCILLPRTERGLGEWRLRQGVNTLDALAVPIAAFGEGIAYRVETKMIGAHINEPGRLTLYRKGSAVVTYPALVGFAGDDWTILLIGLVHTRSRSTPGRALR